MQWSGSILAMSGKDCVAIVSDRALLSGFSTLSNNFDYVRPFSDSLLVGLSGIATDIQTVFDHLRFHHSLYTLREERPMSAPVMTSFIRHSLYERRFSGWYVAPVVAGFDDEGKPFLFTSDSLGGGEPETDFVATGTGTEQLLGMAEASWRPGMTSDELFECISQCFLAASDRDCMSGQGATVHLVTKDEVITRHIRMRLD
eukprot:TRINITY_DN68429_c0_g1_i1.p1 TRINITY_DN68429_c0_g1~~TRINITY_DN68429_c0_g1_i1.p1  ORF type:complete len:201 (-),score=26.06 TRINITY_DN68429_c0_g1_i1:304-906(-)